MNERKGLKMQINEHEQRTDEWYQIRCGVPSSSNFSKIVTTTGTKSTQRKKYLHKLAGELVTGVTEENYQNEAMIRGCQVEDEARGYYDLISEDEVTEVGFCLSDDGKYGASPDGLVGDKGLLEIKCPNLSTHIGYLIDNKLPSAYFQQVQGQLLVTGREWCDFLSYFPTVKPLLIRVERDEKFIAKLKTELEVFTKELEETVKKIGD